MTNRELQPEIDAREQVFAARSSPLAIAAETQGQQLRGVVRDRDAAEAESHKWMCRFFMACGFALIHIAIEILRVI